MKAVVDTDEPDNFRCNSGVTVEPDIVPIIVEPEISVIGPVNTSENKGLFLGAI